MNTYFVVLISAAKMPITCWGTYKHVAVVEVKATCKPPKMISNRPKSVVRIYKQWRKQHVGTTDACAFEKALKEAEALAAKLNSDGRRRSKMGYIYRQVMDRLDRL